MILSMVPGALDQCNYCHNLDSSAPEFSSDCATCHARGIECGPEELYASHGSSTNYEITAEEDEIEDLEGQSRSSQQQATACEAWANLDKHKVAVYGQMLTSLVQIILACAAFTHGRRL